MKNIFLSLIGLLTFTMGLWGDEVTGFWKTVSDETGKPESIVAIYPFEGKYYGRIIATYNDKGEIVDTIYAPKERAPGVKGNPYYAGLDFIWDLKKEGNKYTDGQVMDPEKGRVYGAEMWTHNGDLIFRGEILFFGRNETWPKATENDFPPGFQLPDLATLKPKIPEANDNA